ncbi:MAG TPA: cytochrome c [Vicinamibacterales bacterium]
MKWKIRIGSALAVGAAVAGYQLLRPEPVLTRHVPITTKIVFNREIAQIFQKKCFQCHTDGNVSVPLTTYKEARPWAVAIKEEILERKMPPWGAAAGYGHFANDMSLTGREISLILSWADGGAPSGVLLVDEDKQPVYVPSLTGWEQGEPDLIVKVAADKKVAPDAPYRVERFDVATGLKSAKWLRALQLDPADRRGIRYAAVYDARNGRWLGTWTPSSKVAATPEGTGVQLPANAKLTVEIGYKGNVEAGEVSGAGDLGLYFFEKAPAHAAQSIDITTAAAVSVAPAKIGERLRAETTLKAATTVASIWPRLGAGARSIEVTAIKPDGVVDPMLWVNNYRAEWPAPYILKEPVALPAGTRLVMTAYYDNTTDAAIAARPAVSITAARPSRPAATLEQ